MTDVALALSSENHRHEGTALLVQHPFGLRECGTALLRALRSYLEHRVPGGPFGSESFLRNLAQRVKPMPDHLPAHLEPRNEGTEERVGRDPREVHDSARGLIIQEGATRNEQSASERIAEYLLATVRNSC